MTLRCLASILHVAAIAVVITRRPFSCLAGAAIAYTAVVENVRIVRSDASGRALMSAIAIDITLRLIVAHGVCQYDYYYGTYRYEDGSYCSYEEWHNPNACYNYYYNSYFGRYYNEAGDPVDCEQQYINGSTIMPYPYYYNSGWQAYNSCPYGTYEEIVGGTFRVCVSTNLVDPGLHLGWWGWINF